MKQINKRLYLVGIISWGDPRGCSTGKPSVHSDVRHALDWITSTTGMATA